MGRLRPGDRLGGNAGDLCHPRGFNPWRDAAPLPILLLLQLDFVPYWSALALVPLTFAFAILRYRLWDIDLVIRRSLLYAALSTIVAALFGVGVVATYALPGVPGSRDSTLLAVLATVLVMLLLRPLHRVLQARIEARFDRVSAETSNKLRRLGQRLREQIEQAQISDLLVREVLATLKLRGVALWLRASPGLVTAVADGTQAPPPELILDPGEEATLARSDAVTRPSPAAYELLVPLLAQGDTGQRLIGVLALGGHRSEQPFSSAERTALLALADQASAALVVADLVAQRREFELSPSGRAAALAKSLSAGAAGAAMERIVRLARAAWSSSDEARMLSLLPQALREADARELASLADGFRLLLEDREDPAGLRRGLQLIAESLRRQPGGDSEQLGEGWLLAWGAIRVTTVEQIVALSSRLHHACAQPGAEKPGDAGALCFVLAPIAQALEPTPEVAERRLALQRGRRLLERATTQKDHLDGAIVSVIIAHWADIIERALSEVPGRPRLELRLLQAQVIGQAIVTLLIEIVNCGDRAATTTTLTLTCDAPALLLTEQFDPGPLAPRQATVVEARVRPGALTAITILAVWTATDDSLTETRRESRLRVVVLTPPTWVGPLPNPYVAGRPLEAGSPVFVGRDDELTLFADHLSQEESSTLLLLGRSRIGKTSLLRRLGSQLGGGAIIVWLDGQGLAPSPDTDTLIRTIAHHIATALGLPVTLPVAEKPAFEQFVQQFLPDVLGRLGERRLILILDEFEALAEGPRAALFRPFIPGYVRALMQCDPRIRCVFVGSRPIGALDMGIWANVLNQALHWRIGCLQDSAVRTLITGPLDGRLHYDEAAVRHIVHLSGRFPYFVQLICRELVQQANAARRTFVLREHVEAALPQIFERGEVNLVDIWRTASPGQQAVMLALAKCEYGLSRSPTTASELATALRERGIALSSVQLETALRELVEEELVYLVEEPEEVTGYYRWRLALFGRWLGRHRSFTDLADGFLS